MSQKEKSDDEFVPEENDESTCSKSPKRKSKKQESTEQRLNNILEQAESYTKKILGSKKTTKKRGRSSKKSKKGKESKRRGNNSNDDGSSGNDDIDDENNNFLLLQQPSILKNELRTYQLDGLNWMISLYHHKASGILADEMGLGKTIQTIALLAFLSEYKKVDKYFLVIAPKSWIPNWVKEFKYWLPSMKIVNLIPRKEERERILSEELISDKFNVWITTYEGVRIWLEDLQKFEWEYLIVDEAHKLKNEASQLSKNLRLLKSSYRLLLTGTPLQNNLHELWALLNFLMPKLFASSDDFDELFNITKKCEDEEEVEERNKMMIKQLHIILRPFLLRRIKKETDCDLPSKTEFHIKVGLTEIQKKIYRELLTRSAIEKGSTVSYFKNLVIQLRKWWNHPYLFNDIEDPNADEFGEHLIEVWGKMRFLDQLLKKMKIDGNQCLIFSNFTTQLNILEDFCILRGYKYWRLDGTTELDERERQIEEFTKPDSEYFLFLISTRAGGLGLNLMSANIVVLYDSDWNPQIDLQAMDRVHRIGQKKPVKIFRLITQSTMEEKMIEKQTMKLKLDSLIIQKGGSLKSGFSKDDLSSIVNYGADSIFKAGDDLTTEDIDIMIQKGEQSAKELLDQSEQQIEKKFDLKNFEINTWNLWEFEDQDYLQKRKEFEQKIIAENVVKILEDQKKGGRREKLKKLKNMNEDILAPEFETVPNEPKPHTIVLPDYRFHKDKTRLIELLEKEYLSKFDSKHQLSKEELNDKQEIIKNSFQNWNFREYNRLLEALDMFLPDEFDRIAQFIETKTTEEVKAYMSTFLKRMKELNDYEHIQRTLRTTKKMLEFMWGERTEKIDHTLASYDDMIQFSTQKNKLYSKESDIALLIVTHKLGYGNWKQIKKHLRMHSRWRFDHVLISRTENELKKRVDLLIKAVEKDSKDQLIQIRSIEIREILKMKVIWDDTQKIVTQDEEKIDSESDQELKNEIMMIKEMKEKEILNKDPKSLLKNQIKPQAKRQESDSSSDNDSTLSKSLNSQSSEISRPKSPKKSKIITSDGVKRKKDDSSNSNSPIQKRKKIR